MVPTLGAAIRSLQGHLEHSSPFWISRLARDRDGVGVKSEQVSGEELLISAAVTTPLLTYGEGAIIRSADVVGSGWH